MRILTLTLLLLSPFWLWGQTDYEQTIIEHRKNLKIKLLQGNPAPLTPQRLNGLQYYAPNPHYRITGTFERMEGAQPFEMPAITGKPEEYVAYGTFTFTHDGSAYELIIYRKLAHIRSPLSRDVLFLPFRDATNGETTYGGGRYLDLRMAQIENDRLTVDFNLAYNPYCVYNDGYSCPVPPSGNTLDFAVEAGEQMFAE